VDNAAILRAGYVDPRTDPDFYEAIRNRDFRTLCCRYGENRHRLRDIPSGSPDPEEISLSGANACFGSVGIAWEYAAAYKGFVGRLADIAHECGIGNETVSRQGLAANAHLFTEHKWCVYDQSEWRDVPEEFSFSRFPWLTPLRDAYNVCGASATIRVEGSVSLTSIAAQTNFITAQAAAKTLYNIIPVETMREHIYLNNVICSNDADFHRSMMEKAGAITLMSGLAYQYYFNSKKYVALKFEGLMNQVVPELVHVAVYRKNAGEPIHRFIAMIRKEMLMK
jgi:hypothetical protein